MPKVILNSAATGLRTSPVLHDGTSKNGRNGRDEEAEKSENEGGTLRRTSLRSWSGAGAMWEEVGGPQPCESGSARKRTRRTVVFAFGVVGACAFTLCAVRAFWGASPCGGGSAGMAPEMTTSRMRRRTAASGGRERRPRELEEAGGQDPSGDDHPQVDIAEPHVPDSASGTTVDASNEPPPQQREGFEGGGGEGEEVPPMPQCYSTPAANPSVGAWKECNGGAEECSPVDVGYMDGEAWVAEMEGRCRNRWALERGTESMPYWTWETSNCTLEEVNADNFCRMMEGRKGILFVGDSLTGQTFDTLASVLRADSIDHKRLIWDKATACDGALKISWYRNDLLDPRTTASGGFETVHCEDPDVSMSRCIVFTDDSILEEYDTLVVNSGAHRRTGGIEAYGDMMKDAGEVMTTSMKRLHGDNAVLIYRNTVPGHYHNSDRMFEGPVDIDVAETFVAAGPKIYGWADFTEKNALLEQAFEATGGGWTLLDAYTPTLLRVDLHGADTDGLHYCIPGPIDHWITLLYNVLVVKTKAPRE